jgi:leucyl-tRNA synthetase
MYEMFMGPLEASKPWDTQAVAGVHRFCHRVWRMICGNDEQPPLVADGEADGDIERMLHKLIKKVGEDIDTLRLNTAIAAMMEFVNAVYKAGRITPDQAGRFVLVLSPFAPHLGEELWQRLGHDASLAYEPWPAWDEAMIAADTIELPVQVNGKVRGRIEVPADASNEDILTAARAQPRVIANIEGKTLVKEIVVPGKLVNLVAK